MLLRNLPLYYITQGFSSFFRFILFFNTRMDDEFCLIYSKSVKIIMIFSFNLDLIILLMCFLNPNHLKLLFFLRIDWLNHKLERKGERGARRIQWKARARHGARDYMCLFPYELHCMWFSLLFSYLVRPPIVNKRE